VTYFLTLVTVLGPKSDTRSLVRYCISNFMTRTLRIAIGLGQPVSIWMKGRLWNEQTKAWRCKGNEQ